MEMPVKGHWKVGQWGKRFDERLGSYFCFHRRKDEEGGEGGRRGIEEVEEGACLKVPLSSEFFWSIVALGGDRVLFGIVVEGRGEYWSGQ